MTPTPVPCRGPNCTVRIFWLLLNGRVHPFDDADGCVSHFATCIDRDRFRKPKVKEGERPITIRAAERITGLSITSHPDQMYCGKGEDGEFWVHARDDKDAASRMVDLHWRDVSKIVMRRQAWKCLYCSRIAPLTVHHLKMRSHGRWDSPKNLVAACSACHSREHGIRVA